MKHITFEDIKRIKNFKHILKKAMNYLELWDILNIPLYMQVRFLILQIVY